MTWGERVWIAFVTLVVVGTLWLAYAEPAECSGVDCFGGMCMDSAACAPGCHCFGGRCG